MGSAALGKMELIFCEGLDVLGPICRRIIFTSEGGLSGSKTHQDLGGLGFRVLSYGGIVNKKKSLCV
jgi:hypothetical protein